MGEEVKAKNEKRLMRAYTRANGGSEGGGVVEISLGGFFKRVTSDHRYVLRVYGRKSTVDPD